MTMIENPRRIRNTSGPDSDAIVMLDSFDDTMYLYSTWLVSVGAWAGNVRVGGAIAHEECARPNDMSG